MNRGERIRTIIECLRRIEAGDADFAVFEDADRPENFVQPADFGTGLTYVEVTSRTWGEGEPLDGFQVESLAALGFSRIPSRNYAGFYAWRDPGCIARLIESAFMILGSLPNFDLNVVRMGYFRLSPKDDAPWPSEIKQQAFERWMAETGRDGPVPDRCPGPPGEPAAHPDPAEWIRAKAGRT
ncbi:MAG TPA: hypothetical protein VFA78_08705 [Chloroflexota bacterium]|nr:hypothetical protein [Chloroflexota bacterium]